MIQILYFRQDFIKLQSEAFRTLSLVNDNRVG